MDKRERFAGLCDFLAMHWKAGAYEKIADLSWIPEDKLATRNIGARIAAEYKNADDALTACWNSEINIFIQAIGRWAKSILSVIEFMEINAEGGQNNA